MIDNEFYRELGDRWFTAEGDAIALLRLENEVKAPWVAAQIERWLGAGVNRVLDAGCGGGYLAQVLARHRHYVCGFDLHPEVLEVARRHSAGLAIEWRQGSVLSLPFEDQSWDCVCLMDILEHVSEPRLALQEAVRVLRPGGLLLFHTFNKTWRSWVLAQQFLNHWISNSPGHIHDWNLFLSPRRVSDWLVELGVSRPEFTGIGPQIWSWATLDLVARRRVPKNFSFRLGGDLAVGYLGSAQKKND